MLRQAFALCASIFHMPPQKRGRSLRQCSFRFAGGLIRRVRDEQHAAHDVSLRQDRRSQINAVLLISLDHRYPFVAVLTLVESTIL